MQSCMIRFPEKSELALLNALLDKCFRKVRPRRGKGERKRKKKRAEAEREFRERTKRRKRKGRRGGR